MMVILCSYVPKGFIVFKTNLPHSNSVGRRNMSPDMSNMSFCMAKMQAVLLAIAVVL